VAGPKRHQRAGSDGLTPLDRAILRLLAEGFGGTEISRRLKTDRKQVSRARRKPNAVAFINAVKAERAARNASDPERLRTLALQARVEGDGQRAEELEAEAKLARAAADAAAGRDDAEGLPLDSDELGIVSGFLSGAAGLHAAQRALFATTDPGFWELPSDEQRRRRDLWQGLQSAPKTRSFFRSIYVEGLQLSGAMDVREGLGTLHYGQRFNFWFSSRAQVSGALVACGVDYSEEADQLYMQQRLEYQLRELCPTESPEEVREIVPASGMLPLRLDTFGALLMRDPWTLQREAEDSFFRSFLFRRRADRNILGPAPWGVLANILRSMAERATDERWAHVVAAVAGDTGVALTEVTPDDRVRLHAFTASRSGVELISGAELRARIS
jgi:hypothetical protein